MKMRRVMLNALFSLLLCIQTGCSIYIAPGGKLENRADIELLDPNDGPYSIEVIQRSNGLSDYIWEIESKIELENKCRVKYHNLYSTMRSVVVRGEIVSGNRKYPVLLDTGASQAIFVEVKHILENKLSIYPMKTGRFDLNGHRLGLCHLHKLRIGNATLVDQPCLYLEPEKKLRLFGLSIANDTFMDDVIIVGLPTLREFKYIMFDNATREAQFSLNTSFNPNQNELWMKYPFFIEEDFHGNAFLFVKITIAGQKTEIQLDTGSGRGLAINERLWKKIRKKINAVKLRKDTKLYSYIGKLACRSGVIPTLELGNITIDKASISIFPNDSPLIEGCHGLIGMQYFEDTTMVLDFERNIMWLKNLQAM